MRKAAFVACWVFVFAMPWENAVAISGSDDVPDSFREEVAEYYRSLAKTPQAPQTPQK